MFCRAIHTVVIIIFILFDFSNLKRVLSSNHLRNFCQPRTLYNHDLSFFVYGIRSPKVSFFTFRSNAKNTNKSTMLISILFHEVIINK